MNISSSAHWKLKPCIGNLEGVEVVSNLYWLCHKKLCGGLDNSLLFGSGTLTQDPYTGCARHRSTCARTACTTSETIRVHGARPGPALLSSPSMRIDVLPCGGHPLPSLHPAADGADGHAGALVHEPVRRLRAALAHGTNRWITSARPDAKEPSSSKDEVENYTLQSRGAHDGERTVG